MKTILIRGDGQDATDLYIGDTPQPQPEPGSVLIRTSFAGVNRPDILQRQGLYMPPPGAPRGLGLEVSGIVHQVSPDDEVGWKVGDKVCALLDGGGYEEFVTADVRNLLPIPKGLTMAEAATLPQVCLTVYSNMMELGQLKAGETVLVHGGNSGIGSMAVMMAKAFGAKVIATARGALKCEFVRTLGPDLVIDTDVRDYVGEVKQFGGADVIMDIIGGDYAAKNLLCLNFKGRWLQIGFCKSHKVELDISRLMVKQAVLTGSLLRTRSAQEKARLIQMVRASVWPKLSEGKIKPVLTKVYDASEVAEAHAYMDSHAHIGKVVLRF